MIYHSYITPYFPGCQGAAKQLPGFLLFVSFPFGAATATAGAAGAGAGAQQQQQHGQQHRGQRGAQHQRRDVGGHAREI